MVILNAVDERGGGTDSGKQFLHAPKVSPKRKQFVEFFSGHAAAPLCKIAQMFLYDYSVISVETQEGAVSNQENIGKELIFPALW